LKPLDFKTKKTFELAQFHIKNKGIVQELIQSIPLHKSDLVIEIGPGLGVITQTMAPLIKELIAIELDKTRENDLAIALKPHTNCQVYWMDFLKFTLPKSPYKIVSNIPFNLTRKILQKIITSENLPDLVCLILQTEVSDKICRQEGEHTTLSAHIQTFYKCKPIKTFQRDDFSPPAHVNTVAILMELKPDAPIINKALYFNFIETSFENPGQPLKTRLKKHFTFKQIKRIGSDLKINLELPPHTLTTKNWLNLFNLHHQLNKT